MLIIHQKECVETLGCMEVVRLKINFPNFDFQRPTLAKKMLLSISGSCMRISAS